MYLEPEHAQSRIAECEFKELVALPREIDLNEWLASNSAWPGAGRGGRGPGAREQWCRERSREAGSAVAVGRPRLVQGPAAVTPPAVRARAQGAGPHQVTCPGGGVP